MPALRKYRVDIYALIAYIILAIVLTYPLILNLATHVTGDGSDDPALAWNLWWVPYSLINLGKSPIYTDYMFYPIGLNLAFYTLTYLNAFLSIPIQYAINLVIATNVNLWLSFALSGFGAYLLVKYLLRNSNLQLPTSNFQLAAFAAGALYAFSSNKFLYASLGQFNIASSHWIPFYVLFLLKLTHLLARNHESRITNHVLRSAIRYGFLLGLFLLFQALSEFIFASFLIIFTAIYLAYWFIANRRHVATWGLRLATGLFVAMLVFTIPMLPILSAMISDMLTEGDFIQRGLGFADVFSSDVLGFIVPSHLNPIFGTLPAQFHFAYTNFAYLGFVTLALALLAFWTLRMPRARIWAIFAAIFIAISLGPTLMVNGTRYEVPLPFDLLLEIPIIKGNRYPSRWSVMVTLAFAVMVGYGLTWLFAKSSRISNHVLRFTFYALAVGALLFEHLSMPLPLSDFRIPDVYQTIAQDKSDFTVLEIPLAWRNGFRMTGTLDQAMMFTQWYQTAQRHPILGGNTSRNPELKFQYFTEAPVINSIIAVETGHKLSDAQIERDRAIAPDVLRFFGIKYVVWHSPRNPQNRSALDAARAYVQYVLPVTQISDVNDDTGETVLFRVNDLPPLNQTIVRPNDPLSRLNFAEGWGTLGNSVVWATRREAKMFVRMDEPSAKTFSFSAFAPMPNQRMTVSINGRDVGTVTLSNQTHNYSISMPREMWFSGMNAIDLHFDLLAPVASATGTSPASIVAYSAGNEIGDFAHIFVNGIDVSQNERGYNIVAIDLLSNKIESETFDTFSSADESAQLAQFIDQIPTGQMVAVAVRDTADGRPDMSPNLTEAAVNALRSIGASQDMRGKFRWSHAIMGVKGTATGSTCESASETMPTQCVFGIGAMEPNVAAAIQSIRIEPMSK
ncbi:MAG: hypothetical protein HZB51_03235 [Chloroflexi bacterium]|nr:hypothetical protein [Chloroflexota bacterium]